MYVLEDAVCTLTDRKSLSTGYGFDPYVGKYNEYKLGYAMDPADLGYHMLAKVRKPRHVKLRKNQST